MGWMLITNYSCKSTRCQRSVFSDDGSLYLSLNMLCLDSVPVHSGPGVGNRESITIDTKRRFVPIGARFRL